MNAAFLFSADEFECGQECCKIGEEFCEDGKTCKQKGCDGECVT